MKRILALSFSIILVLQVASCADNKIVSKNYSVVPPAGWRIEDNKTGENEHDEYQISDLTFWMPGHECRPVAISIGFVPQKTKLSLGEKWAKIRPFLLSNVSSNREFISEEDININGMKWKEVKRSYQLIEGDGPTIETRWAVTIKDGVSYITSFSCPVDEFEKIEPIYDSVLKTLVLHPE
ncbi:MAG: hypothetical protein ABSG42_04125 [Nitrospirota bacterium]